MDYEIIDFHTHPFGDNGYNICSHTEYCNMSFERTRLMMERLGIRRICGSVISNDDKRAYASEWDRIKDWNDRALELGARYGDFYIPGFHVHPDYPDQSMAEIDRMAGLGVRLLGELVPYKNGYSKYCTDKMNAIVDYAVSRGMIISLHTMDDDDLDSFVLAHKDATIVAAHPGEYPGFMRHLKRMKMSEGYHLDISGYGLFRHGMLRRAIDEGGLERILFGSDFPTCSVGMYLGGVVLDELISEDEKRAILRENACRLLGIFE